jgi:hydrogenase large subunit
MATIKVIDPVTRIEGHLKVTVTMDTVNGQLQVVDAMSTGTLFRGLENVLTGRHPWDAQHITQRMCGVCPVPHSMASVMALQQAGGGIVPPPNATILRNLVLAANFLDSHILHFYHLSAPDYIDGPAMPPWQPSWSPDKRIDSATTSNLVANYLTALDIRRKAHEMCALFGGRMPHPPAFAPGGITTTPRQQRIDDFKNLLAEVTAFINNTYLSDVQTLASVYSDYYHIGAGPGNLLSFGVFGSGARSEESPLFARGQLQDGVVTNVNTRAIAEHVKYSWYDDTTTNLKPSAGATMPVDPSTKSTPDPKTKIAAYSWSKAPRYNGRPFEAGPLARMWINGDYTSGISVMDRHMARAQEAAKIAAAMSDWLGQIDSGGAVHTDNAVPNDGVGEGLTEAPRGAIGHWLRISNKRIANYQVITPSCWNLSPRDDSDTLGPLEQALVGTFIGDATQPVEVLRVIHSFDPCLACAVHVMRPGKVEPLTVLRVG